MSLSSTLKDQSKTYREDGSYMKKAFLLVLLVFACLASACAYADEQRTSGPYTYSIKGNGTITITGYQWRSSDGDVYVPALIDGYNVTGVSERAFADEREHRGSPVIVHLPEGIVTIGEFAFMGANISNINIIMHY